VSELVTDQERHPAEVDDAPAGDASIGRLERIVESVLFAAATPVSLKRLVEVLAGPTAKEVQGAVARLREHYNLGQRGIQLQEVAGGYQFRTARENAEWVRAVFRDKPARLGRAALETLAIVAYKQPVTRAEIEAIRGVDVDGVLNTLLSRRLIKIAGRKEAVGRPLLYATTPEFLESFGLKDLNELPSLKELGPAPDESDADLASTTATAQAAAASAAPEADAGVTESAGGGTVTEAAEPSRDCVSAQGGGADSRRPSAAERPGGEGTGDESQPEDGSHHH